MAQSSSPRRTGSRPYMVAMLLGSALTALNASPGQALTAAEPQGKTVADLSRYCTTCWRNARLHPDQWSDCTQEVFSRLLERVAPSDWAYLLREEGDQRREFFRAIDAVKKRTQRARRPVSDFVENVADARQLNETRLERDREAVQKAASELLSSRQQQILQLSFEGWSVQEIADEMHTPAERVSDEKYKAIRKLRAHLSESAAET